MNPGEAEKKLGGGRKRKEMPDLWMQCSSCNKLVYKPKFEEMQNVCPECNHHYEISSVERIDSLLDKGSFEEKFTDLYPLDPLEFVAVRSYEERLRSAQDRTKLSDACVVGIGKMDTIEVVFGVSDSRFLRGSMGSVVGEKITRILEAATERRLPAIIISSSGGARMYEGMFSLMQLAKTSAAIAYHGRQKLPYISVLTHPTTAGVMASYASLGDLIISEPKAMIGFAGPRVIKDTTQSELPEGFQTAEFLMERGLIDAIIPRTELKKRLSEYLDYLCGNLG